MTKRILRRFPAYRNFEKTIRKKNEALELGAAAIRSYRAELAKLQKKAESDANLTASLNRYIEALEGRDKMRAERINELKWLCREHKNYITELEGRLSGITPREETLKEEGMTEISVQIPMTAGARERWEKFIRDRGYAKGAFIRSFIEAVTDPARGPQIERIIQNRTEANNG